MSNNIFLKGEKKKLGNLQIMYIFKKKALQLVVYIQKIQVK